MANLAYKIYRTEDLRDEFIEKGFSEEAIDFILFHNGNYNFEVLREKMSSLEQQIINLEGNLKKDIDFVKVEFKRDIFDLDVKIDNVKNELNIKIDNLEKNLQKDISNLERNLLKEIQSNNAILKEEIKSNNAMLLEKLNIGNRMLNIITVVGLPIIISIIASILIPLISKFF
ncbi:BDR-repeat family protein (plasmid) [Borrelia crocidurae DOU]|uniref:BDR-repeat family protein n=1 Tax=Borrelia crocidurae DOU TaxID=1293575 RepID=W5SLY9_9SPIR|nr:Bdr family repetitive protein [Borrelia crocidurae]AHH07902.1 BDR-repeat family protein [Borrelia crocidurae DOU]